MDVAVRHAAARAPECVLPLVLHVRPIVDLSEEQFFDLCQLNPELCIERTAEGEWLLMTPVGGETSHRESELGIQLGVWAKRDGTGLTFSSSGGFRLPNGAVRSPDAAWLLRRRYEAIPAAQRQQFLPLCPDFVLELRSPTDRLADLQAKMQEYLANGARLGWLLDPAPRHVYVYRPEAPIERLDNPATVAGDPELPGFVLDLQSIW